MLKVTAPLAYFFTLNEIKGMFTIELCYKCEQRSKYKQFPIIEAVAGGFKKRKEEQQKKELKESELPF